MNTPYVKSKHGETCPPQNDPNRKERRLKGKYIYLQNPLTGKVFARIKPGGNNRKHNRKGRRVFK